MKKLPSIIALIALSACAAPKTTMSTCSLDDKNFAERKALFATLMLSASNKKAIQNGYIVVFPTAEKAGTILRIIELEQSCCPFLSFRLDVPAGEPMKLEITGPANAVPLIKKLVIR